jgi:hypothetical protein
MAYLGHLVRLVVPMQGHAEGEADADGTLSEAVDVWPQTVTVPISIGFVASDLTGVGVWEYEYNPSTDEYTFPVEKQAYRYVTVRVSAIDISTSALIISRAQTDISVAIDGGKLREWINDPLDEVISYNLFGLKDTPSEEFGSPRVAWTKRSSSPHTLDFFNAPYNKWGIAPWDDWPGASFTTLGTGEAEFTDTLNASSSGGGAATYIANRIASIGDQKYLVYQLA